MSFRQLPVPGSFKTAPAAAPAPKNDNSRRRPGAGQGANRPCNNN